MKNEDEISLIWKKNKEGHRIFQIENTYLVVEDKRGSFVGDNTLDTDAGAIFLIFVLFLTKID